MSLILSPIRPDPVIAFAAQELQKYLGHITGETVRIVPQTCFSTDLPGALWLGLADDLPGVPLPPLESDLDDAIAMQVEGGQGWIAGANPRSVLLAVYRFLHENGCRWPRPTSSGEIIPHCSLAALSAQLSERAAFRHRGICIEGAVSLEHVLAMIEWAPKLGFSAYFHQFREGHTFFHRWYSHRYNPHLPAGDCSVEQARAYTRTIEAELARRGMIYHAVGHGWTCEAFGIPGLGWDPVQQEWPAEVLDVLALVNGKRAMWYDIPMITSLCFSNPLVRQKVVECVAGYLEEHPNIQALHFWLDDGFNNKCECEACTQMRPSDFYIQLLNDLDEILTHRGHTGKIVFLAYADLLWPPEVERIKNPERFILMFAPITRSYRRPLSPSDTPYSIPPYQRNQLVFSDNNDEQFAFLRGWQSIFQGDSFIFEYHLIQAGAYFNDPDGLFLARLLHTDIRGLRALGLNGYVSCQFLRNFFPTGLGMYVLGRSLWDEQVSFETLEEDYFASAFGPEGPACREYLLRLGQLQDVLPLRDRGQRADLRAVSPLQQGLETMRAFSPVIERNLALPEAAQTESWRILKAHARLLEAYLAMLLDFAEDRPEAAARRWQALKDLAGSLEEELQTVLDVYGFIHAYEPHFGSLSAA